MKVSRKIANIAVAAVFALLASLSASFAQSEDRAKALDELFAQLAQPDQPEWASIDREIWRLWSQSGSPALDLLLERGRRATKARDFDKAIEHLSALIDHAPDFAKGYNARATAWFMAEEYGLSLADIEATLALEPRHYGALSGLGMIMELSGRPELALRAFEAAKAIHPHRPDLLETIDRLTKSLGGQTL